MIVPRIFIIPLLVMLIVSPLWAEEQKPLDENLITDAIHQEQVNNESDNSATDDNAHFQELVQQAQAAYEKRQNLSSIQSCIELYRQALQLEQSDWQVNLEYAQAILWFQGYHGNKQNQNPKLMEEGIEAVDKALAVQPDNLLAHYVRGLLHGFYGQILDSLGSLEHFEIMENELAWVEERDPAFDYGGIYRALGRYYSKLPGLLGGDEDKALDYYNQARDICPQYLLNDVLIAELYKSQDKVLEARELLQPVLESGRPVDTELVPEWHMWQARARRAIDSLPSVVSQAPTETNVNSNNGASLN